jgi:hypothetical protein
MVVIVGNIVLAKEIMTEIFMHLTTYLNLQKLNFVRQLVCILMSNVMTLKVDMTYQ